MVHCSGIDRSLGVPRMRYLQGDDTAVVNDPQRRRRVGRLAHAEGEHREAGSVGMLAD
jgi:hypothetical protein